MSVKSPIAAVKTALEKSKAERTSPEVIAACRAIMYLIGGLICSLARLFGAAGPFGVAAVAVSGAGLCGISSLFGAAVGYIISEGLAGSIRYLAAIVLVYTVNFSFQEAKAAQSTVFMASTAAAASLVTGVLASFTSVFSDAPTLAVVGIETVFSFAGCVFFRRALDTSEPISEAEEQRHTASVLISAAIFLMALSRIEIFGVISLGRVAAAIIIMAVSLQSGCVIGCTIAAAFGAAMDLTQGGAPFYTMAYAFAGLLSGMFSRNGRIVFLLSFIGANAAAVACAWSAAHHTEALFEVFSASVIFMLLPSELIGRVGAAVRPVAGGSGESGLRRYAAQKVMGLSAAYESLYDIVRRNTEVRYNDSDPAKIFDRAADSVCLKCKDKNRCWNRDYIDTLSALDDATGAMLRRGMLMIDDLPERFTDRCRMPDAFVTAVNAELRASLFRRQCADKLRQSRNTAWEQYSDMSGILKSVSKELSGTNGADHLAERRLIRFLLSLDIDADAAVYRDARGRLRAVVEGADLVKLTRHEDYLDKLSSVLGVRLCRLHRDSDGQAKIILMEAEPFAVSVGIAALKKKGERVSGDRGTYFKTDSGVLCVILSDGMGTGEKAAGESREIVSILEGFLRAGVDPAVAMRTLNSVMLLKCGSNWGFATVDLMCVDLFSGVTSFYKYGAAPSYVRCGDAVRRVTCSNFAPGLTEEAGAAPDVVKMRLKPGSVALIASDGAFGSDDDEWIRSLLLSARDDMKALAADTLREAEKGSGCSDDMTVLAVRISERD